jgi:phenylpropionate dioxygenase-like ring-hydroxylating dioxygenase large terminal subunit
VKESTGFAAQDVRTAALAAGVARGGADALASHSASLAEGEWLRDAWYVACTSDELRERPIARTVLGIPITLFRERGGRAVALLDRCPHRNAPLSIGAVRGDRLECAYHGWQFDAQGICRLVPGLCGEHEGKARRVATYAVVEQDGFVWVFGAPNAEPAAPPYRMTDTSGPGYTNVHRTVSVNGGLFETIENALDVTHTAYVHRGLIRGGRAPIEITAVVSRTSSGVEAEYIGEPSPPGLAVRILAPAGGVVRHIDRFLLPCIAQVDYWLGDANHFRVTSFCTPVDRENTTIFATISLRLRIPARIVLPLLSPIAWRIFHQDARILKLQTETMRRFGGESFVSTDIDVLGTEIKRLLKYGAHSPESEERGASRREVRLSI